MAKLRVGIIGASVQAGWGARAHIPALRSLEDFEIVAVATTRIETAEASAAAFGIERAFGSVEALLGAPGIDVVSVCVRVPHHAPIVSASIQAGKHVYCEWPLTVTTEQAQSLTEAARTRGVTTAIGLQARVDPAVRHARQLLRDGFVGEIQAASLTYSSPWPVAIPAAYAAMQDAKSGLSQLELSAGHNLDALSWLLGDFSSVYAFMATQVPEAKLTDTGQTISRTSADQIVVQGIINGATVSAHILGAPGGGTGTRIEIQGTTGSLLLVSPSREAIQSAAPVLSHFKKGKTVPLEIPPECTLAPTAPPGPAANVANMYAAFGTAIRSGSAFEHDFDVGLQRHRLLDTLRMSASTGTRLAIP